MARRKQKAVKRVMVTVVVDVDGSLTDDSAVNEALELLDGLDNRVEIDEGSAEVLDDEG